MKKTGISKLIAIVSALAIMASHFTAFAQFALTAEHVINKPLDNGGIQMLAGFSVDSKNFSYQKIDENFGLYHSHLNWEMNRAGWNAEDSMNIFPIGTPDTAYSAINSEETFFAEPYAYYVGTDFQIWNGYMFVVLEKTTWPKDENGADIQNQNATLDSVIQVYDIANGAKEHIATWDTEDLGLGGTAEGITYGIREIEVTDDNIFVLVDMAGTNWTYKYDWSGAPLNTQGCGLAVYDNNISREDEDVAVPTRSALQPMGDANSDMARYGVDVQNNLAGSDSLNKGAVFMVRGDYLIYMPTAANGVLKSLYSSDATWLARNMGVYTVKWNEARTAGQKVEFTAQTIAEWIPFPEYPEDYRGMEPHSYGNYPQLGALSIDGDVMYADIVYTKPDEDGVYHQYDEVYTIDISNPLEPTIIGKTAPISSPTEINFTNRVMTFDEDYIYISQKHYHHFDDLVKPYIFIIDKQDMTNPVCVNAFALRNHQQNAYSKGAESLVTVGDYMIVHSNEWTIFMAMSADRTEIVDSVAMENMMAIGDRSGGVHGAFIYGNRIFYPSLHGTGVKDGWRFDSRIEVIDFSGAIPMGIFVDEIQDNNDGTYTISGTARGVNVTPAWYDLIAISVTDTTTKQQIGEIYFADLETDVDVEEDVVGWSYTTDESTPNKLTFTLHDEYEEAIPDVYEEIILNTDGEVEPGPTPTPGPIIIPDSGLMADDVSVFVDFEKDYPDYTNYFTVWGEYYGDEEDEMQILTAVYDSDGKMLKAQVGEIVELIPGESFAIEDCIYLDDPEIENTVLKVFVWNSAGAIRPMSQAFQTGETVFSYVLESSARTSAGVYDEDGTLIRTLWSGVEEPVGYHTKTWDGRDDNGVLQANGKYTITVMENNVEVNVDAFIGNTSDHSKHEYIMSGYSGFPSDMMYVNGDVYYIYPYSEGKQSIYYFNASNPHRKAGEYGGTNRCMQRAVTDGQRMYVINTEIGMDHVYRTYVYAFDLGSRQMYMFEDQGQWLSSWGINNHYYAVNVLAHDQSVFQTGGMGVQKNGNMLFVSYVGEGKVYVLNKNNGSLINSQSFNTPRALAYNENGGLWVGYKKNDGRYIAERYNVGADGSLSKDNSIALEHDFGYLEFLELSPDGKRIVAADGATNQYKMYSTETGKLLWTYGSGASYEEDPTIYPDKLMLKYTGNETDMVFAEFENDNTLWLGDIGNNRAYKMNISSGQPVVVDQIMMQPGSHSLGVDVTDPTKIFSNAIQYEMDYQESGVDSWTPVKNWKKQVEKYNISTITFNQFNNFITLPNGRTYFSAWRDDANRLFYFEGNDVYYTGINFNDMIVLDDGRFASVKAEDSCAVHRIHNVIGYNQAGDPIFDEGTVVARLPIDWTEPGHIFGAMKINMPITDSNVMITLRSILTKDVDDRKTWHLGGVKLGDEVATDWAWKTSPEGSEFYVGNFPTDGTFEAGNGVLNTAQKVVANGKNVIFEYNGEFYKQLQTNKLFFYRDNGLLVGMFGEATWQRRDYEERHLYGKEIYPGNAFDMYFIQDPEDSDRAYILQNNENGFGNFKYNVTGLDSIKEHKVEIDMNIELWDGLTYSYYAGDATDVANLVTKEWRKIVDREAYVDGDNFVMRYTGYLTNPNGTGNLKLAITTQETMKITIDGQQIFNGTGNATPEIYMEAGKLYPFSCEITKNGSTSGGKTKVSVNYYDTSNRIQAFTTAHFKTDEIPYTEPGVVKRDLLEGLPFASAINSGTYGINWGIESSTGGVNVNTNSTNASFDAPRDIRFESNLWPSEGGWWATSAWMTKNMGTPRDNLEKWEIEMDVSRSGYLNYGNLGVRDESTGVVIEVQDVNGRVIANFYWAKENKVYGNNEVIYQANISGNNMTSELYAVPSDYHNEFNTPNTLKITADNGQISFEYCGGRITTNIVDPEAQWDRPAQIKFDAFFNYDRTQAREMSTFVSRLDYTQYSAQ